MEKDKVVKKNHLPLGEGEGQRYCTWMLDTGSLSAAENIALDHTLLQARANGLSKHHPLSPIQSSMCLN